MWYYIQNMSAVFRGGYYVYTPEYINPFPVPAEIPFETEKAIITLVDYILFLKSSKNKINQYIDNDVIIRQFETVIDALIYELYFPQDFKEADIAFAKYAIKDFESIDGNYHKHASEVIEKSFQLLREMDNQIRNNIKYMAIKMEHILGSILNA